MDFYEWETKKITKLVENPLLTQAQIDAQNNVNQNALLRKRKKDTEISLQEVLRKNG